MIEMNRFYNCDNMEYMATVPDKYFELAVVDPPYGIGVNGMNLGSGKYKTDKEWDSVTPTLEYFEELFRVSKNQIIWGANYFTEFIPPSMGWIFWNKKNGSSDFSDGELAFSSFKRALRMFEFSLSSQSKGDIKNRFHPTQKPVALYRWILQNYAKKGDKIFDSHVGSGSSIIACIEEGFEYVGCELDKDYYNAASNRIEIFKSQGKLF